MTIEQITTSRLIADEGKVLIRKSDGYIVGPSISLGYDYYEANVPLSHPHAFTKDDFEEIDQPSMWKEPNPIHQVSRLKRTDELIKKNIAEMNSLDLSASQALEVAHWFPKLFETEGYTEGQPIAMGVRVQYEGKLWETRQAHTITTAFAPSLATASLWMEVTEEGADVGTLENPIAYEGNMELEEGKYYTQEGVTYLCTRDTGNPVYHALKDLVGLYVEVA
jgi:hypothetical protein